MRATIDDQGRIQIPPEFRDRLHLAPGDPVDLNIAGDSLNLTRAPASRSQDAELLCDGSLLLLVGSVPLTLEEANRALESGRAGTQIVKVP